MERFIVCETKKEREQQIKKWRDGDYHVTHSVAHSAKGHEIYVVIIHGKKEVQSDKRG